MSKKEINSKNEDSSFFIIELIKVIIWPILSIILFFILFPFLIPILNKLPDSFEQVESLSYASFKIELKGKEEIMKDSVLSNAVSNLSKESVKMILDITDTKRIGLFGRGFNSNKMMIIPNPEKMKAIGELYKAKLLDFTSSPDTIEIILRKNQFYVRIMPELGIRDLPKGQILITESDLNNSDYGKLMNQKYFLTEKGKQIYSIMKNVTLKQSGLE